MGWQHDLARQIRESDRDQWPGFVVVNPADGTAHVVRQQWFVVPVGMPSDGLALFESLIRCVSDRPTAGVERGCLAIDGFGGIDRLLLMKVCVREIPWNHFLSPDGQWRQVRDDSGKLPFPEADLSLVPSREGSYL